jgi:hypothetical protein
MIILKVLWDDMPIMRVIGVGNEYYAGVLCKMWVNVVILSFKLSTDV